jgi:hypothetical protein
MRGDAGAHGSGAKDSDFIDALHNESLGMKVLKVPKSLTTLRLRSGQADDTGNSED